MIWTMKDELVKNDGLGEGEILLVDKPAGISSFGVVAKVRRKLSEQAGYIDVKGKDGVVRRKRKKVKVGHTGTLDPFATGLLILLVGKGTKRANEFLKLDKEYVATVKLGYTSSTGDIEGEITPFVGCESRHFRDSVSRSASKELEPAQPRNNLEKLANSSARQRTDINVPLRADVEEVVGKFIGEVEQRVPSYSAVKINGERAYKLARAGKSVEMPVRKVRIDEIEILRYEWPELEIRCKVSSGTYIRALGEDIGKALGVGGYLTSLRRTQVGKYRVEEAIKIDEA